ncbi:MAG TPA: ATP-binding protein [Candidatus Saccharimonadales bacterium]|nr:ATP-binding protein [Candidatus Saccharimonadales bacterium]
MNDVMQVVAKGWYRLYYGLILLFAIAIVGAGIATRAMPDFAQYQVAYGLSDITLIVAGILVLYCLTAYWIINRTSPPGAMLGASMLLTLLIFQGLILSAPGQGSWAYVGAWLVTVLFSGMFGLAMVTGSVFFAAVYVLFLANAPGGWLTPHAIAMLAGSAVIAIISYFFWRSKFLDPANRQLTQLTGMLQSNQEQSAILIQSIADGVIVTDNEGKIGLINPAAAAMTEWGVTEATGLDVHLVAKLKKEDNSELSLDENPFTLVLETKKQLSQNYVLTGQHEKQQHISLVISPVAVPGGGIGGAVAIMHDISSAKAAEQQRAEFISTASHEMRTPVAAIEGYLALALNEKVSTIDSRARGYLEKAHSSTKHLGQLFQDLLTSAKAEDGRLSNHPAVVEMGEFTEQLAEDLRFGAQKKGLASEFLVGTNGAIDATSDSESTPKKVIKPLYYVYVDPDRLREVITNLFDNAVKYTDNGKVSLGLTGNNEVVQLYIRDTGPGIPAEDIPHLFQKFYRVDNSATRTIGGTGLGLFICRKIIELYHGRIWVESTIGQGSSFFINLPRLDTTKAQMLQKSPGTSPSAPASPPS